MMGNCGSSEFQFGASRQSERGQVYRGRARAVLIENAGERAGAGANRHVEARGSAARGVGGCILPVSGVAGGGQDEGRGCGGRGGRRRG